MEKWKPIKSDRQAAGHAAAAAAAPSWCLSFFYYYWETCLSITHSLCQLATLSPTQIPYKCRYSSLPRIYIVTSDSLLRKGHTRTLIFLVSQIHSNVWSFPQFNFAFSTSPILLTRFICIIITYTDCQSVILSIPAFSYWETICDLTRWSCLFRSTC